MSILRVGSTRKFSDNWDSIFSSGKKKSAAKKSTAKKKATAKKKIAAPKKSKKSSSHQKQLF